MKVIVTGDSHVWAVVRALQHRAREEWSGIDAFFLTSAARIGKPFHERVQHGVRLTEPGMASRLIRQFGTDTISATHEVLWIFSLGLHSAGWFRDPYWSKAAPAHMGLKGQTVSRAVFNQMLETSTASRIRFMEDLKESGIRFQVLSAPPPRRDHYAFRNKARIPVRLEVDRIFRSFMERELTRRGVPLILPPSGSIGEDGFLLPEYRHVNPKDQHHANTAYGERVLAQIAPLLRPDCIAGAEGFRPLA